MINDSLKQSVVFDVEDLIKRLEYVRNGDREQPVYIEMAGKLYQPDIRVRNVYKTGDTARPFIPEDHRRKLSENFEEAVVIYLEKT